MRIIRERSHGYAPVWVCGNHYVQVTAESQQDINIQQKVVCVKKGEELRTLMIYVDAFQRNTIVNLMIMLLVEWAILANIRNLNELQTQEKFPIRNQ